MHPTQPIVLSDDESCVFQHNEIIKWLLENSQFSLEDITNLKNTRQFTDDDYAQFLQLTGCRVDTYTQLSFCSQEEKEVMDFVCLQVLEDLEAAP
jgi:hypothetical protein